MTDEVWTKTQRLAPFNKETGSLESYYLNYTTELRDATIPFSETLLLHDFDRGWRSAHRVVWLCEEDGRTFPMFIGKFLELVKKFTDTPLGTFPRVHGLWGYCKRGSNYGIELLEYLG